MGWTRASRGSPATVSDPRPTSSEERAGASQACAGRLEPLCAVEPSPSGRRQLYHLQDTHFNARGNRLAGEALAEFLR